MSPLHTVDIYTLHVLVSIFLCVSKFEALLLENVRIPQSEIELKQIEAGWAAGDRITACSTPRWLVAGGWWLVCK